MGFLSRLKNLHNPRRRYHTGGMWDNTNTPGSVGFSAPTNPYPGTIPSTLYPYENSFVPGPNPEPYLTTGAWKDPYRLHSRIDTLMPNLPNKYPLPRALVTQRELIYDAGNTATIRADQAHTASQQYFNQRVDLGQYLVPAPSAFANSVQANIYPAENRGWEQAFVPEPGMRSDEVGFSHPTLLSKPIQVTTTQSMLSASGNRGPIKTATAPKRKR